MTAVDEIRRRQRERRERLAGIRASFEALTPPDREELLADLLDIVDGTTASSTETAIRRGERITLRDAIARVLADGSSRSTADIYHAVLTFKPDVNKGSVYAEVVRMRKDNLLIQSHTNGRGGSYALVSQKIDLDRN